MYWIVTKYFITAGVVVLLSELAKRSEKLAALFTAMPLVVVLTLIFLLFPVFLQRMGFWLTMLGCLVVTVICFVLLALLLRRFGILLL